MLMPVVTRAIANTLSTNKALTLNYALDSVHNSCSFNLHIEINYLNFT